LRRADLRGADLRGAKLEGVDLEGADLHRAKIDVRYSVFLSSIRLKGYKGTPDWEGSPVVDSPGRDPGGRYTTHGMLARCSCGSFNFLDGGPSIPGTHALTCVQCTHVMWFIAEPL